MSDIRSRPSNPAYRKGFQMTFEFASQSWYRRLLISIYDRVVWYFVLRHLARKGIRP